MKPSLSIYDFLKTLPDSSFFFPSKNSNCTFLGIADGETVAILVVEKHKKLKKNHIEFSSRVIQAGGIYLVIRSLDDICEIAKVKGWHD